MAKTRVVKIDQLFDSAVASPLKLADADPESIRVIQELLICQGYSGSPNGRSPQYGKSSKATEDSLKKFRLANNLQGPNDPVQIDHFTLHRLAEGPFKSPRASRGFIALALDFEVTGMLYVICLTALWENFQKFSGNGLNGLSDQQGLSYGIIQWAQGQKRLAEIVQAFKDKQPNLFSTTFGPEADQMLAHINDSNGGISIDPVTGKKTGKSTDPAFDLILDAGWADHFEKAAFVEAFQKIQIETALADFKKILDNLRNYAIVSPTSPANAKIKSQRGHAFMLDIANQFGNRKTKIIYENAVDESMDEAKALQAIVDELVRRTSQKFKKSAKDRREFFRTTDLLSEADFNEN